MEPNPARRRDLVRVAVCAALVLLAAGRGASAGPTVITATLTDVDEAPGEADRWRVRYDLEDDFAYPFGYTLVILVRRNGPMDFDFAGYGSNCGWATHLIVEDPALLAAGGLDDRATPTGACTTTPALYLGALQLVWLGEGPTPEDIHLFRVLDESFQVVEAGTIQVPEPAPEVLSAIALATLAALGAARRRRRGAGLVAVVVAFSALSTSSPAGAEPFVGNIVHSYSVDGYAIDLQPVSFERIGNPSHRYVFDLRVRNDTGAPTAPALLVIGVSDGESYIRHTVPDGFRDLPAMAAGETVVLAPLDILINRGRLFRPETVRPCIMPVPVPGPSLPESDPAVATVDQFITSCALPGLDMQLSNWRWYLPAPPSLPFTPGATYSWNLETNQGSMKFELRPDVAPLHVSSILYLSRIGFYDGLVFHRVIQGFMAQGGGVDPDKNDQTPGFGMHRETDPAVLHQRGVLSTANTGEEGSESSGFFIPFVTTSWLDGLHTISGELVEGEATLQAIEALSTPDPGVPSSEILITNSSIEVTVP